MARKTDPFEYSADKTQRLSRLRHVFSRIQPGNSRVAASIPQNQQKQEDTKTKKKTPARELTLKKSNSPALLSGLASLFLNTMPLKDIVYNGMNYIDAFTGTDAVVSCCWKGRESVCQLDCIIAFCSDILVHHYRVVLYTSSV
jgi:hypothetical protein